VYRLVEWPGFMLKHLEVHGTHATSAQDVLTRARIDPHANIWLVNLGAAGDRIEALPYVRTARLERLPPATISIVVTERVPNGCLEDADGSLVEIDADRRVLALGCEVRPSPVYRVPKVVAPQPGAFVRDAGLARLQADELAIAGSGVTFGTLEHDRFGQLEATLPNGVVVRFGDEQNLEAKARLVKPILQTASARAAALESIDLRAPSTPVVRYREPNNSTPKP
jgi:cell division protein FtsQ